MLKPSLCWVHHNLNIDILLLVLELTSHKHMVLPATVVSEFIFHKVVERFGTNIDCKIAIEILDWLTSLNASSLLERFVFG